MARIANLTASQFDEAVTARRGMVLVDLWSPDCVPCRTLAPVIDDIAADLAGEVAVCKVDVAAEPGLSERLAVRGVPTLALFRDGREIGRLLGIRSRSQLMSWIGSHL